MSRVACLLLALLLAKGLRADEEAAIKALGTLGANIERDDKQPNKPVVKVFFPNCQVPNGGMKEIKEFKQLKELTLTNSAITDEGLKGIGELKQLQNFGSLRQQDYGHRSERTGASDLAD